MECVNKNIIKYWFYLPSSLKKTPDWFSYFAAKVNIFRFRLNGRMNDPIVRLGKYTNNEKYIAITSIMS